MINIDYALLQKTCTMPIESFWELGKPKETANGTYTYINRGSNILSIAHLDTVYQRSHFHKLGLADGNVWVMSPWLDNRLGTYILLHLLPTLGIELDVLLTEGEEAGKSTAAYFTSRKKYKWMVSFDRASNDVVCYRYTDASFSKAILDAGYKSVSHGTRSDIDYLAHLGCRGLNIGNGLVQVESHGLFSTANMNTCVSQVEKFVTFYDANKDTLWDYSSAPVVHTPSKPYAPHQPKADNKLDASVTYKPECVQCLRPVEKNTDWLCKRCQQYYAICIVNTCKRSTLKALTVNGLCGNCVTRIELGHWMPMSTIVRCKTCHTPVTDMEQYKHPQECIICHDYEDDEDPYNYFMHT